MGLKKEHRCPNCGYTVVTSGGEDAGMVVSVETHVCGDCQSLTDVVTVYHMHDDPEMVFKPIDKKDYSCTECEGHNLLVWDTKKRPCPRCGATMTTGDGVEILWD